MTRKVMFGTMLIATFVISGCASEYDKCISEADEDELDCLARADGDKFQNFYCSQEALDDVRYCSRRYGDG